MLREIIGYLILAAVLSVYLGVIIDHARQRPKGKRIGSFLRSIGIILIIIGIPFFAGMFMDENSNGLSVVIVLGLALWLGGQLIDWLDKSDRE